MNPLLEPIFHSAAVNPNSWPMPAVVPSCKTSRNIQQLVKERGIVYQPLTLDSGETPDPCLLEPKKYLLSQSDLSGVDPSTPVLLMAPGFSATSYEWEDLSQYVGKNAQGAVLCSKIVLGGHGHSLPVFKNSNWKEWGKPILKEYQALVDKGFKNISIAGSSTACALILKQLSKGSYAPKHVFLVDPIVEPNGFLTHIVIRIGALFGLSYPPTQAFTPEEFSRWHGYRPFSTLLSLDILTQKVQKALAKGIQLPEGTSVTVWASQGDPTVNPDGYKHIQKGVKGKVSFHLVNSKFHVFTRLTGRPQATDEDLGYFNNALTRQEVLKYVAKGPIPITLADRQLQKQTFDAMLNLMTARSQD